MHHNANKGDRLQTGTRPAGGVGPASGRPPAEWSPNRCAEQQHMCSEDCTVAAAAKALKRLRLGRRSAAACPRRGAEKLQDRGTRQPAAAPAFRVLFSVLRLAQREGLVLAQHASSAPPHPTVMITHRFLDLTANHATPTEGANIREWESLNSCNRCWAVMQPRMRVREQEVINRVAGEGSEGPVCDP